MFLWMECCYVERDDTPTREFPFLDDLAHDAKGPCVPS